MKLILIIFLLSINLISCGKSPLMMKANTNQGQVNAFEYKTMFKSTGHLISTNWLSNQNTIEEGKVLIILTKNNKLSDIAEFTLSPYIWMESMGHGSSPIVVTKLAEGIFELSEIYFSMPGDWQLHLQLTNNNKVIEDVVLKYNIVE